jgi:hypothetical protein
MRLHSSGQKLQMVCISVVTFCALLWTNGYSAALCVIRNARDSRVQRCEHLQQTALRDSYDYTSQFASVCTRSHSEH